MCSFTYKGKVYELDKKFFKGEMVNDTAEFHLKQYQYLINQQDWVTLENRIIGALLWGGLVNK